MTKRLVDIDDDALEGARSELRTRTIKDTVNESLRLAADQRRDRLAQALTILADAEFGDRGDAWR